MSEIKPNPEVYLKAMQTLQAKPQECIVFEDSLIGIEAAKAAGLAVVAVYDKYSAADMEKIKKSADFFINDYAELLPLIDAL